MVNGYVRTSAIDHSHQPSAITARLDGDRFFPCQAELAPDSILDRRVDLRVVLEELLGVLAALAEALAVEREPGAALLDDPLVDGEIQQVARARDAFAVHHVELG